MHVSEEHVQALLQMGFDEAAARDALAHSDNSVDRALARLVE